MVVIAGAFLTTCACSVDIISPFSLYYSWHLIVMRGQIWRLVSNFFFFSPRFSLEFLFHMFFLYNLFLCLPFPSLPFPFLAPLSFLIHFIMFVLWLVGGTMALCNRVRYCRSLEEGSFRGRTADFFWMILFGATIMSV
jgi:Derlin-2/3